MYQCCPFGRGTQAVLETEFPHINMLEFVSHNFKRPSSVQDKDFWLLLGPRPEGISPDCQWVGICPIAKMPLIVAHLPSSFLVCWQCSELQLSQSGGDWGIFRSGIGLHITPCGCLAYNHCEFWMRLPKFWIVNNPSDKAVWSCSHYFFSCLCGFKISCHWHSIMCNYSCLCLWSGKSNFFSWCHSARL